MVGTQCPTPGSDNSSPLDRLEFSNTNYNQTVCQKIKYNSFASHTDVCIIRYATDVQMCIIRKVSGTAAGGTHFVKCVLIQNLSAIE